MKKFSSAYILLLLAFAAVSPGARAQNCSNSACLADTVNISTGYSHGTSSYLSPTVLEQNWKLTGVPSNSNNMSPNGPSWIVQPFPSWSNFTNARWVSPLNTSAYTVNNWPPAAYGAFVFENCICVCNTDSVRIKFDMLLDDAAYVYMDNILLDSGTAGYQFLMANRLQVDTTLLLTAGTHCLKVRLHNGGGVAMGFAIDGYVASTNNLQKPGCCNPNGRICGIKHEDRNCNGILDSTELLYGMSGVSIVLKDSSGTPIDTAVTDGVGGYCFDVPPGIYSVSELPSLGWTQTYPSSPDTYAVSLDTLGCFEATFGNCDQRGSICGKKYYDYNCNGVVDPGEPTLSGWQIVLQDSLGNPMDTATTDYSGAYCLEKVMPGTHLLVELAQAGWSQSAPSSPDTLFVDLNDADTADFLNCNTRTACDSAIDFTEMVLHCGATFQPDFTNALTVPGWQFVSASWTFGDGYSANELTPTHYYENPGTYNVCLKALFYHPLQKTCCYKTYCKNIVIYEKCEGPCDIDAILQPISSGDGCRYTFSVMVNSTGAPITNWFWDFGDGKTATGSSPTHQYLATGTYQVCVTMYAVSESSCCSTKVCMDLYVQCDPCDEDGADRAKTTVAKPLTDKMRAQPATGLQPAHRPEPAKGSVTLSDRNIIVLNQNVPNPFAESTVISYNIPTAFRKAQLIIYTTEGQLVRTVNITEKGIGQFTVYGNDLGSGSYKYTLVVDGKIIDAKTMVKN